jgi:hypothetical protein
VFLYLLEQDVNTGDRSYESLVVCAPDEQSARLIHPLELRGWQGLQDLTGVWCYSQAVTVTLLGTAHPDVRPGVVCASLRG